MTNYLAADSGNINTPPLGMEGGELTAYAESTDGKNRQNLGSILGKDVR